VSVTRYHDAETGTLIAAGVPCGAPLYPHDIGHGIDDYGNSWGRWRASGGCVRGWVENGGSANHNAARARIRLLFF